jgi:hypothetical protein
MANAEVVTRHLPLATCFLFFVVHLHERLSKISIDSGGDRFAQCGDILCHGALVVIDCAAYHNHIGTVIDDIANVVQVDAAIDLDIAGRVQLTQQVTHPPRAVMVSINFCGEAGLTVITST